MNCEECQELLSDLVDNALNDKDRAVLEAHLEGCVPCLGIRDDLNSIVSFCREHREEYEAPPNPRALWLRIQNTLEVELGMSGAATARQTSFNAGHENWWSRLMNRSWELSLPQLAGAVAAIVIAVSLATAFSFRRLQQNNGAGADIADSTSTMSAGDVTVRASAPTYVEASTFNVNDRLWQQQQAISYWNQRIEQRKALWSPQMRSAFERNMSVIDQAVNDSLKELSQNPHDEVSEEMLNTALNDKMELLREFSDL